MSFPDRFLLALGLTLSVVMQACPFALAQNSVLQGSVRHDYVPSVIRQDQVVSNPVTVVRVQQPMTPIAGSVAAQRAVTPQRAQVRYVERPVYRTVPVYVRDDRTFFQRHPKV
ncbi:MAG: hypothetical protein K2Z81_20475, partial [Cyanobacteria bacterium]|nr:hypothetical protein [Cyanobacteriota bacterium]